MVMAVVVVPRAARRVTDRWSPDPGFNALPSEGPLVQLSCQQLSSFGSLKGSQNPGATAHPQSRDLSSGAPVSGVSS